MIIKILHKGGNIMRDLLKTNCFEIEETMIIVGGGAYIECNPELLKN